MRIQGKKGKTVEMRVKKTQGKSRKHYINLLLIDKEISVVKQMKPLCSLVPTFHWQVGQVSYSSCSRKNVLHTKTSMLTGMSATSKNLPIKKTKKHKDFFSHMAVRTKS